MTWTTLFNLHNEVSKIAPPKNHTDSEGAYGVGDDENYGHVKVQTGINNSGTFDDDVASISAIKAYVSGKIIPHLSNITDDDVNEERNVLLTLPAIKQLITQLITDFKGKLTVSDIKLNNQNDDTLGDKIANIEEQINSSTSSINLNNPIIIDESNDEIDTIDDLKQPGYYYYDKDYDDNNNRLKYNNTIDVCHKKSLVTVEKQPNGIIVQHIYSTDDIDNKLDGTEYIRFFKDVWSELSIKYKPTTNYPISTNKNETSLTCKENTAGFIITWKQINEDNSYTTSSNLYEYETIGTFSSPIPIGDTPYIFSNLIGKIDIKVSKNNIQVRSTLKESKVKNVNTTFFIPRLE